MVYSPQSTDVHLLNAPAYDLIDALSAQSLTESDLVAASRFGRAGSLMKSCGRPSPRRLFPSTRQD